MSYYIRDGGRTATFVFLDVRNQSRWWRRKLDETNGTQKGSKPLTLNNAAWPHYPMYEIITVNGMTEVIEHREMQPIFYVTDDPAVLAELGVAAAH